MAKKRTVFICENCGYESPKWAGKCPDCGRWNSFTETQISQASAAEAPRQSTAEPVLLSQIRQEPIVRISTGIGELDRVLGDGIFPASVVLVAGDPGIGKSTLLLQMIGDLVRRGMEVLYVSGEESLRQIQERASRLGLADLPIPLLAETELENILHQIHTAKPQVVVIDSIQSLFSGAVSGTPGHIGQVRECTARLFHSAKKNNWTLFLIGHITKEGGIAGPKILEHTVDVVINFEGDQLNQYRILRTQKNRFGATHEIGLFVMEKDGLKGVENPSSLFLSREKSNRVGTSVVCSFEGTRPLLAEVQSLVSRTNYGVPQRTVSGFDHRRLALLLAILEKHCGLNFGFSDVFVKIAGGLRIDDPGIDLGIALSVFSSITNRALPENSLFIGEIGLNGEVRSVSQAGRRIQEGIKLGFKTIHLPLADKERENLSLPAGFQLVPVKHIGEFIQTV